MKNLKEGDIVALVGFTGIRLTDVEIVGATKTQVKALKADGSEMIFSKKDGVQTNVEKGKEKYANKIMSLEDAPVNKKRKKQQPKPKKDKVVVEEPEESFDEEFEDEEVEETEVEDEEVEEGVEEVDYSKMNVKELRQELADREIDIPTGSKKADLLALLEGETEEDFDDADDFDEEDGDEWADDEDEWEDEFEEI